MQTPTVNQTTKHPTPKPCAKTYFPPGKGLSKYGYYDYFLPWGGRVSDGYYKRRSYSYALNDFPFYDVVMEFPPAERKGPYICQ